MNRENVIERMVEQYREHLEEKNDEELLGSRRLEVIRENVEVLISNMVDYVREETIEEMVDQYQRQLDGKPDEELFGGQDDSEQRDTRQEVVDDKIDWRHRHPAQLIISNALS